MQKSQGQHLLAYSGRAFPLLIRPEIGSSKALPFLSYAITAQVLWEKLLWTKYSSGVLALLR